jgi:uncharacterized membrane protein
MVKSASAIMRSYLMFKPYVIFATLSVMFGLLAVIPFGRFLILWVANSGKGGNVQSLIFGSIMAVAALLSLALGVLSDLLRTNRILLEEQLERVKEIQYRRTTRTADLAFLPEKLGELDEAENAAGPVRADLGIRSAKI